MTTPGLPEGPTPPPHPYAQPEGLAASSSRGLSIAAMSIGLVALLTTAVAAFYSPAFVIIGVLLAFAAIVLGIIALVKRQRPIAPSIIGVATGALALCVALAMGVVTLFGALITTTTGLAEGTAPQAPTVPDTSATVEWPANMASGGIRFVGEHGDISIVESDPLPDNSLPDTELSASTAGPSENKIQVYVDYRCPYCAQFEQVNSDTLEEVVENGSAELELHPLAFLDRVSAGSYYSSRASGAVACVAHSQPDDTWDAHEQLLDDEFQPAEGDAGHDNAALIAALDDAVDGLNSDARSCIESEQFVPFAQAINSWSFENPVPGATDDALMVTGTPFVVVNGIPYTGSLDDPAEFRTFLTDQGVALQ